jgi:hypothetical protein
MKSKLKRKAKNILLSLKKYPSSRLVELLSSYLILRIILGPSTFLIYVLIGALFLFRYSFEKIAFIFIFLCIITYLFGLEAEANRYMSFVYIFFVVAVLKYICVEILKSKKDE